MVSMSSYSRKLYRQAVRDAVKARRSKVPKLAPPKRYRSFNIFTKDGENRVVNSKTPMTLDEAQYYYDALSISGNE